MTVKEASIKFQCDEKEIRKRIQQNMLVVPPNKIKGRIHIHDSTTIIPSKKEIQAFLVQIIRLKNNESYVVDRQICPTEDMVYVLLNYLYQKGFIGTYTRISDTDKLLRQIQLTDTGFRFIFGEKTYDNNMSFVFNPLSINPSLKIGLINT